MYLSQAIKTVDVEGVLEALKDKWLRFRPDLSGLEIVLGLQEEMVTFTG